MGMTIDMPAPGVLGAMDVEAMWAIYAPNHHVSRSFFEERLRAFDRIALFREGKSRRIRGFTGVRIREIDVAARRYGTLYFGQSYIEKAFRGKNLIQRTVVRLMATLRARSPRTPWFLWSDALSYKPYLVMARNLAAVYPHPEKPTPPDVAVLLEQNPPPPD